MPLNPAKLVHGFGFSYEDFLFDTLHRQREDRKKLNFAMDEQGFFECGQREDHEHPAFEADDPDEEHLAEAPFVRPQKGTKRPYFPVTVATDEESDSDNVDLDQYFDSRGTPAKARVLLCRSYASYVAAQVKEAKRLGNK